jgi:hypothetical protein
MSFFGRAVLTIAVVAGVAHVFRRDLRRILGALQKPTEQFISEVKRELEDKSKAGGDSITGGGGGGSGSGGMTPEKSAAGAQAAAELAKVVGGGGVSDVPPPSSETPSKSSGEKLQ